MTEAMVVLVTTGNEKEALDIANTVVKERLAACASIISHIRSIYRWKGEIQDEPEVLLLVKTRKSLFASLKARIKELHSYEVAEIIGFPVDQGDPDYLKWIMENTQT